MFAQSSSRRSRADSSPSDREWPQRYLKDYSEAFLRISRIKCKIPGLFPVARHPVNDIQNAVDGEQSGFRKVTPL